MAYFNHTAHLGGAEIALERLLRSLPNTEAVVILGDDGPLVERARAVGARVQVLPLPPPAKLARDQVAGPAVLTATRVGIAYCRELRRVLRRGHFDVLHTTSLKAHVLGGLAGRLAGLPVIWGVTDRIAGDHLPVHLVRLLQALGRVVPAAIIANSQATATTLEGWGCPITVIPPPLAPGALGAERRVPSDGRSVHVAMIGRLTPWKGQHLFLEAFAKAFPAGDERATIIGSAELGEDDYAHRLPDLAAQLGVAGRVRFAGFVEDIPAVLREVDVLVHASVVPEPFGLVVIEGMAAGVAVVASAPGGPAETIDDGRTGCLFPLGDVDALAQILRDLSGDPALRDRLGAAGRVAAAAYEPERIAARMEAVYRTVSRR
ncbi:glycosyltransferase family 4 protein [soil metagenome]